MTCGRGWVPACARTREGGRAVREPPLRRGRMDGVAGRIGGWIPAFVFTRQALRGNNRWGCGERVSTRRGKFQTCLYVRGSIGIMWGRDWRFANRAYEERRDIEHGRWAAGSGRKLEVEGYEVWD